MPLLKSEWKEKRRQQSPYVSPSGWENPLTVSTQGWIFYIRNFQITETESNSGVCLERVVSSLRFLLMVVFLFFPGKSPFLYVTFTSLQYSGYLFYDFMTNLVISFSSQQKNPPNNLFLQSHLCQHADYRSVYSSKAREYATALAFYRHKNT